MFRSDLLGTATDNWLRKEAHLSLVVIVRIFIRFGLRMFALQAKMLAPCVLYTHWS
jgi:hypothetical protein